MKNIAITPFVVLSGLLFGSSSCSHTTPPDIMEIPSNEETPEKPGESAGEQTDGATIIGKVTTPEGTPIADIVVSDGIKVTLTDKNGEYRIVSDKSCNCVFVSLPGNYTAELNNNLPQFYQTLTLPPKQAEIHNFKLYPADNYSSTIIIHADQHLANRTEDLKQFNSKVLPDINSFITHEKQSGRNVVSISLGDSSWDQFWKSNSFDLMDAVKCLQDINSPIFHTIGNHDNNPYIADDWKSSAIFRMNIAPSYYSFNIGDAHFIILDNVIYNNPGATASEMGERSYDRALTENQLEWLKADLSTISDKTSPLVICAHVPFYAEPTLSGQNITTKRNMLNTDKLEEIISSFTNVTLFSGHYHRNFNVESPYLPGVTEHNVASLSGSLWWTGKSGYAGNHLCTDGTPGGYGVLRLDGKKLNYSYKCIGFDENYQFRVYDLNKVRIDESCVSGNTQYKKMVKDYADIYYQVSNNNEVLVNLFSWQPGWKIEIEEEGVPLYTSRVRTKDPLHILSYECQRLSHNAVPTATSTFSTQYSTHFFKARASKPDTRVTVKVTDNFGKIYIQTIDRPKNFSVKMN